METNMPDAGAEVVSLIPLILLLVLLVVPYWKLWQRTGHSGAWGLLMLVPIANIVSLWVLAFKRWPALGDRDRP
jgi:hypothetical protein